MYHTEVSKRIKLQVIKKKKKRLLSCSRILLLFYYKNHVGMLVTNTDFWSYSKPIRLF